MRKDICVERSEWEIYRLVVPVDCPDGMTDEQIKEIIEDYQDDWDEFLSNSDFIWKDSGIDDEDIIAILPSESTQSQLTITADGIKEAQP
jgi:hypothetical protein